VVGVVGKTLPVRKLVRLVDQAVVALSVDSLAVLGHQVKAMQEALALPVPHRLLLAVAVAQVLRVKTGSQPSAGQAVQV
jgi:carbonic anhydrase